MHLHRLLAPLTLAFTLAIFGGCATAGPQGAGRGAMLAEIQSEQPGNYVIGRRYYKADYKFWGWVRKPGQPWSSAVMVMMNENTKLAPDRELGKIGSDNNYEYKLVGDFSGQRVYEPASNGFYQEFILKGYELRSVAPGNIYKAPGATDPQRRVIVRPY